MEKDPLKNKFVRDRELGVITYYKLNTTLISIMWLRRIMRGLS